MSDVVVVGAGLAGLSCALSLERLGVNVTLLESSDAPGGRMRTDFIEGFRLDRGFQVLLTAYPEAKRQLDYASLQLKKFEPGALVWHGGKFHRFADPFRDPTGGARMLFDSFVPLKDKLQVAKLRARVQRGSIEAIFTRLEKTTRDYLQAVSFSAQITERFFEPFFGGVFLERELVTSSRFFEFLFRMFSSGDAVVPAAGMEQIPLQLAAKLRPGTLVTGARVRNVTRNAHSFVVDLEGREPLQARAVVLAVEGNEGNTLLGGVGGWRLPEVRGWNKTTAFCYAAERAPADEAILLLNGEGRDAGPVNHVAVMSAVSPAYAPPGAHLVVANVVGEAPAESPKVMRLEEAVRVHLRQWFGTAVDTWRLLRAYPLAQALPQQRHAEWEQSPVRVGGSGGVYMCGDYRETASIQGALASGRRVSETVAADLVKLAS
ncbi:MAG TPA: NAD(P)/FAD-dependent oxidoreductase [Acidobacteriaceae bacterium]|nr:NAD(P)/FAD-dependent oxidoreductase [Acidobacteriaceae bacterium]